MCCLLLKAYKIMIHHNGTLGVWATTIPQCRKDTHKLVNVKRRAMTMVKGPEPVTDEDKFKKLGIFSPEKRRLFGRHKHSISQGELQTNGNLWE